MRPEAFDAVGHGQVLPRQGEVVVEPGNELDGGWVREARPVGERVLRPGVEGQQHRLADLTSRGGPAAWG